MKDLILLFLIALTSSLGWGQTASDLVGTWKVQTAKNEDGGACDNEIKNVYKFQFNSDGTYSKQEKNWNGDIPVTSSGTYAVSGNKLQLIYVFGAATFTREIEIISVDDDNLTLIENLCPLRDQISRPKLVLYKTD